MLGAVLECMCSFLCLSICLVCGITVCLFVFPFVKSVRCMLIQYGKVNHYILLMRSSNRITNDSMLVLFYK